MIRYGSAAFNIHPNYVSTMCSCSFVHMYVLFVNLYGAIQPSNKYQQCQCDGECPKRLRTQGGCVPLCVEFLMGDCQEMLGFVG